MATPMMEQYNKLKAEYDDCILFFRMGDFYEGFEEDAKVMSRVLGITLTGRGKGAKRQDMAGVPYHALHQYLPKLVKAGYKVAIAEQLEEAQTGKIVKRDVVKVVTPGTILDEKSLETSENNYLAAIFLDENRGQETWGLAYADLSTGEFQVSEYYQKTVSEKQLPRELLTEIFRIRPAEILIPRDLKAMMTKYFGQQAFQLLDEIDYSLNESRRTLQDKFNVKSLKGFGIEELESGIVAAGALYTYLLQTQKTDLNHITKISRLNNKSYMLLDQSTIRNLELVYPLQTSSGSKTLFDTLNKCYTPMGQRRLRHWILRPLLREEEIQQRLDSVEELINNKDLKGELAEHLNNITDLERVLARLGTGSANARDLNFLKDGLINSFKILSSIKQAQLKILKNYLAEDVVINEVEEKVVKIIEKAIQEEPALTITEGNIIRRGFNVELDEIKTAETEGKDFIKNLQKQEIEQTGISSLKVRFNKVFGYYIEVSKSNLDKVPEHYIRKQTLVNAERFITDELKKWEEKVLGAEEKAAEMEYKIFEEVRNSLISYIHLMQQVIERVAQIDVLVNFANLALENKYTKPQVFADTKKQTLIKDGRHPVVESFVEEDFIPNDVAFDAEAQQTIILTGPNMSGKSTYIRQNALIFLMAQMGCFVPASLAEIAIADRIFTRVGASDNLASGESTFMVEMNETANILNNATERSLLILDEVGRGTSTYDGVAIAWAVVEHIAARIKARTLFATHYHELIQLEDKFSNVKNFNVEVKENKGKILFMRKIIRGGTDQSYGIHVGEIAGLPDKVISRAKDILSGLEQEQIKQVKQIEASASQMSFGEIQVDDKLRDELKEIDINLITPLDALQKLKDLQDKV